MPDAAVESQVEQQRNNGTLPQSVSKIEIGGLRQFYLTGRKNVLQGKSKPLAGLSSVFTAGLRNLAKMRSDFPAIDPVDSAKSMVTLPKFINGISEQLDGDSDETEELRHYLYLVENAMRDRCLANSTRLEEAWKKAAKAVVKSAKISKKKKEKLESALKKLFKANAYPAEVLAFDPQLIQNIFSRIYSRQAAQTHEAFLNESRELLQRVTDILSTEYEKTDAANSPQELANRLASGEFKLDSFSRLMAHSHKLDFSQARNARLQLVKDKLAQLIHELESGELTVAGDFKTAFKQYEASLNNFIACYRARQIAKLEVANRYVAQKHDAYFENFDLINIPVADLALIWPAVVYLKQSKLTADQLGEIARLATSEAPIKVILEFDTALETAKTTYESPIFSAAVPRLLRGLLQESGIFAAQLSLADFESLAAAFAAGLEFDGPAIWGVFAGEAKNADDRFRQVYGANFSRVVPAFALDYGKGSLWADKFSLAGNENPEMRWNSATAAFTTENREKVEIEALYTAVDFLSEQPAFAAHCFAFEADEVGDEMVAVADLPDKVAPEKIPFVVKYDKKGKKYTVVISQFLLNSAIKILANWRNLQELAGIENSHVLAQMQIEKEKLDAALIARENEREKKFQAKLDATVGSLADEIVGNIAAGLLGQATAPVAAPAAVTPVPAALPDQPAAEAEDEQTSTAAAPEEADDDEMSFDAAYIDTPLCTSCNECVQRNSMIFAYDGNQQATIKDAAAGPFRDIVEAAEKCPVKIIHPGKPLNPDEAGLEDLTKRAEQFN